MNVMSLISKPVDNTVDKKSNMELMLSKMLGIDLDEMKNVINGMQTGLLQTIENQSLILEQQTKILEQQTKILFLLEKD